MRILHVLDHSIPLQSGYTFRTRAILEHQQARGWATSQVTGAKQGASSGAEETVDGLRFYRTAATDVRLRFPGSQQWSVVAGLADRIVELVGRERPDVLHAHSPALNGLAALRAAQRTSLPVVYECRAFWEDAAVDHGTSREGGLRYRLTRALETYVFRRAEAITTICDGLRGDILGRGIPSHKVSVIPNAVDLSRFGEGREPDRALSESLGLSGKVVFGFIGSFYAYEGLALLLESFARARARSTDGLALLLVGGGPCAEALRASAPRLGLRDSVAFAGRVSHDQVQRYYDLVDVFVYPRLSMRLTELVTPLKPLEAMAKGRIVLASDVGGHRELVRDGETGFLFPAGNPDALAASMLRTVERRREWPLVQGRARRFVEAERTWPASIARYQQVYDAATGGSVAAA